MVYCNTNAVSANWLSYVYFTISVAGGGLQNVIATSVEFWSKIYRLYGIVKFLIKLNKVGCTASSFK